MAAVAAVAGRARPWLRALLLGLPAWRARPRARPLAGPGRGPARGRAAAAAAAVPIGYRPRFCSECGAPMHAANPEGDRMRDVCTKCGRIAYQNPKVVCGCIVAHHEDAGRVLLARRAIEPCLGRWTVPAGYLELGESSQAGAERETWEEVEAKVTVDGPFAHFDIPVIGQNYYLYRSTLAAPFTAGAGPETQESRWFDVKDLPWDELAFSSVRLALQLYIEDLAAGEWAFHQGVIDKVPGSHPADPGAFRLVDQHRLPPRR